VVGAFARRGAEPLPRGLVWVGTPVAALLLFAFFVYLGFPYDRLAGWISWQVGQATGTHLIIGELRPRLGLLPGFEAHDVRVMMPDGLQVDLTRAWLRPAWSWSWLRGVPALAGELEGDLGRAEGVAWLGERGGFEGELRQLDVSRLPLQAVLEDGVSLRGRLDADVNLHFGQGGPVGQTHFVATQGSILHPALPVPLPFEALSGELEWGPDPLVKLASLRLEGPLVSGGGSGTIGRVDDLALAPLDLSVDIQSRDPNVRSLLQSVGARPGRDGSASFHLTGTLGDPVVR
jgi:type II secretion system protein N